ncbi:MAG: hypothetical protein EZS28_024027 [Streblomastix strix]|uniref:Uncharacterized protein n=1 Tax=Streblomastix strix TaxID=222440 RepID=A0A5J4VD00_9EUKA|nr:MAG: hypothetical protein EZS28_024027 [Streblomastix strix]
MEKDIVNEGNKDIQIAQNTKKQAKKRNRKSKGYRNGELGKQEESESSNSNIKSQTDSDSIYDPDIETSYNSSDSETHEDDIIFINSSQKEPHPYVLAIQNGEYDKVPQDPRIRFIGNFEFINTKRCCYGPKYKIYKIIKTLFPAIKLTAATYYRKVSLLKQPKNRTDLCQICEVARQLTNQLKREGKSKADLTDKQKAFYE